MLLRDLRNRLDFFLRSQVRWGRRVDGASVLAHDAPFHAEFDAFFSLFHWEAALAALRGKAQLTVADIGCRTFLYAPVLERRFATLGVATSLHGIEIDAYRRFTNFHTRHDYGQFYASCVKNGRYHPIDVLSFLEPLDVALLLDPFVLPEPLLRWGLPKATFAPEKIVNHIYDQLRPQRGLLVTSNPTEEEFAITNSLCRAAGFSPVEEHHWHAPEDSESTDRLSVLWTSDAQKSASSLGDVDVAHRS